MTGNASVSDAPVVQQLWFTDIHQVEVRTAALAAPTAGEVLVKVDCSAISAGTEMLVYRGQIPAEMALDASLTSLQDRPVYPLQYGYASAGQVVGLGAGVDQDWLGKRVFSFQPHASHFIAQPSDLIEIPDDISAEAAVFLPNMETAVNLIQDGAPALGERVAVLGQGIVGLLVSGLLAQYPLAQLTALDAIALRRERALQLGVGQVCDPFSDADIARLKAQLFSDASSKGADLVYEVSGSPQALNLAIELSGFASRIVIGSWYGNKTAAVALGGDAHRNRLKITTSQVSSLAPELSGRWSKARRFELTWQMLRQLNPQQLISHRVAIADAPSLYQNLHESPDNILQAIFLYP
ncbi:MAG TPA: zinc-binding alcohol dehydrogenase [Cellvibrio sp.]|nr:zinc-binding alcohol dehydrogenase [Cellvibrio sp.]